MASSKPISHQTAKETISLIDCAICLREMEHPKALPCLHTFCLKCLKQVGHPPGRFVCPLCKDNIALPPGGVDSFRDNFFINQLKEKKAIYKIEDIKVACICCKSSDRVTLARCMDCNGLLCQQCVHMHQNLTPLMAHNIFTIEEIRSGKVDPSKLSKEQSCQKHRDQVLKWFCKSCKITICRDCTVMEHTHPDHHYVTLESVTEGHMKEISELVTTCQGILGEVNAAITTGERVKARFHDRLTQATKQSNDASSRAKEVFLKALQDNVKSKTDQLVKIQKERDGKIESEKKTLQNMQSKVTNAIEIANQVMMYGSKSEVASNYSTLCKSLTQLQEIKPTSISQSLSVVKFKPSQGGSMDSVNLGTISSILKNGKRKWVLEREIGNPPPGEKQSDRGDFGFGVAVHPNACGVAVHPNTSDIYIANHNDKNIRVFDSRGNYKKVIQYFLKNPRDVAFTSNGFLFITDYSAFVTVFNPDGKYLKQFPTISPDGKSSAIDRSQLCSITVDKNDNLLVGNVDGQYISKHKVDGRHVSSFRVTMSPFFISSTPQGRILITPLGNTMQILDSTGMVLHTITTPKDAKSWNACSSCCSDDGIIYVTSHRRDPYGIYSFTEDGEYLGCVTTDVTRAMGIALIDNDRLVVVQAYGHPTKIFSYDEKV